MLEESTLEDLLNNPVHISDQGQRSAFIPFCSFGEKAEFFGRELIGLEVPVCSLFRERIVNGQVCYEADINQYKTEDNWEVIFKVGLSLIIDTNDEYDVRNILERRTLQVRNSSKIFHTYKHIEDDREIKIMFRTISEIINKLNILFK